MREEVRAAIYQRMESAFPAAYGSAVPIGYENIKFDQPKDEPHLRVFIYENSARRSAIGVAARFDRIMGNIAVEAYVPQDAGTADLWGMVDAVNEIYNDYTVCLPNNAYLVCGTPFALNVGSGRVSGYVYRLIMIPFRVDTLNQ